MCPSPEPTIPEQIPLTGVYLPTTQHSSLSSGNPELEAGSAAALGSSTLKQLSPAALAYLGDAVYELFVRRDCLLPPRRVRDYHQQVVARVRAETQAAYLMALLPYLSPQEQDILRQGRNAAMGGPKRLAPEIYQQASGLETLLGYLYLHNLPRLQEILAQLGEMML